jgi:hypothetical protein
MLVAFVFLAACIAMQNKCGYHAPPEYARIFDLPLDQQAEEYRKLPLDKQVDMYLYAMQREPPSTRYVDLLASNGTSVIPHLLERLNQEEGDYAKTVLIRVFRNMHEKFLDLRNDKELMETLKNEVSRIRDSEWRAESEQYLKEILEQPGMKK